MVSGDDKMRELASFLKYNKREAWEMYASVDKMYQIQVVTDSKYDTCEYYVDPCDYGKMERFLAGKGAMPPLTPFFVFDRTFSKSS